MADRSKWFEHKRQLSEKGLIDPVFTELHRVSFQADRAHNFEPLLIARHAQRMGELVDRCLTIRKDIRELEVLEVKAATDYDLFDNTSALDEQMDILRLQMPSKTSDQAGYNKAAAAFSSISTLEKGLREIAKGRDTALGADLKNSGDIQGLTSQRWQKLRDYQNAYHARYTEPGNAHNYGERAKLLLKVLTVLMEEALARAIALSAGVQQIYGASLGGVPASLTLQSIDDFAVWALTTIRSLSRATEQEAVSDIIIPLVQPWLPSQQPLIKPEDFKKAVSSGTGGQQISLGFDLPNNGLLDPRTRLRGIGVSFGNDCAIVQGSGIDRNQTVDAYTKLAMKILTPAQSASDGSTYHRPPILIGNVGLHGPTGAGSMVEGASVDNISPFGTWQIDVHSLFVWKDARKQSISAPTDSDPINDLKLALRVYVPGTVQ
jgi:hypothetical protein